MSGGSEGKKFRFNWRNTVDGEPDAQTRRDWVEQMGTPYPREHVMRLFREAREKHDKRKAEGADDDPEHSKKKKKKKKTKPKDETSAFMGLELDLSDDEESVRRREAEAADGASSSSSVAEGVDAAGTSPEQPAKSLVQARIDHMFQSPTLLSD